MTPEEAEIERLTDDLNDAIAERDAAQLALALADAGRSIALAEVARLTAELTALRASQPAPLPEVFITGGATPEYRVSQVDPAPGEWKFSGPSAPQK